MRFFRPLVLAALVFSCFATARAEIRVVAEDVNQIVLEATGLDAELAAVSAGGGTWLDLRPKGADPAWGVDDEIGAPELPVLHLPLRLPEGAVASVESVEAAWFPLGSAGLQPLPHQPPRSKREGEAAPAFAYTPAAYERDLLPAAELGAPFQVRGASGALLTIRPYRWNGADATIQTADLIRVRIALHGTDVEASRRSLLRGRSPLFDRMAADWFVNDAPFAASLGVSPGEARWMPGLPVGYLVVTADSWEPALAGLLDWKAAKGFEVSVARTSVIGSTTTAIQSYIKTAYETWPVPPTYVLLVGDTDKIPAFIGQGSTTATDLYYAAIAGSDYFPDLSVGRLSGRTLAEIQTEADKIQGYEEATFPNDAWTRKACFMASDDGGYHAVAEGTHRYVINHYMKPTDVQCDSIWAYYGGDTQDVRAALNDGRMLAIYSGHGSTDAWAGPYFGQNDVRNLTNGVMTPFATSHACITGSYDLNECFAETWVRVANKGSVAFWGSSNYTYWDEDDLLERYMFDAAYTEHSYAIGGMTDRAKRLVYQYYGGGGMSRYYYECYQVFGDPSMDLWLQLPKTLTATHASALPLGTSTFQVTVRTGGAPVDSALVCLRMDGEFQVAAYTDDSGLAVLQLGALVDQVGLADLTVTAHNYRPLRETLPIVVPALVDIQPASIPVTVQSAVTVSVQDTLHVPMAGVVITVRGWGVPETQQTTAADGTAHFLLTPPYGEQISVVGRRPADDYDLFQRTLPVTGATYFFGSITASVPDIGLSGQLTCHYDGLLHGSAMLQNLTLYARGCGVDASASGAGNAVDLIVQPSSYGTVSSALAKAGYNVLVRTFEVVPVHGTVAGTVRAASNAAPIASAKLAAWPAGSDTSASPKTFSVTTDALGNYAVPAELGCDPYDVYVQAFGFLNANETRMVWYGANIWDFSLANAPSGLVSGLVREAGSGSPLAGTIEAYRSDTGALYASASSGIDGLYQLTLPYFTYELRVRAAHHVPASRWISLQTPALSEDFDLATTEGNILVVNDNGAGLARPDAAKPIVATAAPEGKAAADVFHDCLVALGYEVTVVAASAIDPGQWTNYDLIVWSAGRNQSPVSSSTARTALQNWVLAGGKLLIEGGEIGYDACSSPGYSTFASQVLHCTSWYQDSSGNLKRNLGDHPLMTTPNVIPATATHNYGGDYGTQDGMGVASGALSPMTWTTGQGASLVSYDSDGSATNGGNIAYYAFEIAGVQDAVVRDALIENSVHWLIGTGLIDAEELSLLPSTFRLQGPQPNPSTGARLVLALPEAGSASIDIYDAAGRHVTRAFEGRLPAGMNAVEILPAGLPAGVYWLRARWSSPEGPVERTARWVRLR